MKSGRRVVVLGGGIAGLTAAHELVERGFDVQVFERAAIAGGKARSLRVQATPSWFATPSGPGAEAVDLPGEHGFRFFPGFYRHVVDTMSRIPFQGGAVADNLVDTTELWVAADDRPAYAVPMRFPHGGGDLQTDLVALIAVLSGRAGVPLDEGLFFGARLWEFLTSCEERRMTEYERINWWDFIEAGRRSSAYQRFFGNGITRSLVAAKARRASTRTIGDILVQLLFEILLPDAPADRVLNGPTSEVWLEPWMSHLRGAGVAYQTQAEVRALRCRDGALKAVTIAGPRGSQEVEADYFIGALPVEKMAPLLSPELLRLDPSLANLNALVEYVEWMNGVQFYLNEDLPLARGHVICLDSPWALTLISQPQFWGASALGGAPGVRGLLSVDVSDWDVKGRNGKEARACTRDEIAREVWDQLKRSLNVGRQLLRDQALVGWHLDPDIQSLVDPALIGAPAVDANAEPLLVNYVDTWRLRPEAVTRVPNLFLASDYVRTFTDLATMEAANEAARRAVNGVLRASGADADACALWNLHEPELLTPLRAHDRLRYRGGLPWDSQNLGFVQAVSDAFGRRDLPVSTPGKGTAPAGQGEPALVAAGARASSDGGLRRWRIKAVT